MTPLKSIVVPCYNEAANLPKLIQRFADLATDPQDFEVVLVNNGSTDNSAQVFAAELAKPGRAFIRVVEVPSPNIGYGHGIMTGLRACRGQYLAWTHADGQTPPSDVLRAFDLLLFAEQPARTLVKGLRRQRPVKDTLFTMGMQAAAVALLGRNLTDINGQPKAFARTLLELATHPPTDLSLDLYFFWLAREHGFSILTFDVNFGVREHGESKWAFNWRSKVRNIRRTLRYMNQLRGGSSLGPTA